MKKIFAILLCLGLLFTLFGCNLKDDNSEETDVSTTKPIENATAIYENFLNGTGVVYANKIGYAVANYETEETFDYFLKGQGYDLAGFIERSMEMEEIESAASNVESLQFAYIDCGADGTPELLLKVTFQDEMTPIYEYVIKEINSKLEICYRTQTHHRYQENIVNKYGLISSGGSSGAAVNIESTHLIDKNGDFQFICQGDFYYDFGKGATFNPIFTHVLENYEDKITTEMCLCVYSFEEYKEDSAQEYNSKLLYSSEDADIKLVEEIFGKANLKYNTKEEIDAQVNSRLMSFGLTQEMISSRNDFEYKEVKNEIVDSFKSGGPSITVSNVQEFVNTLADRANISMSPGEYVISDWIKNNLDKIPEFGTLEDEHEPGVYRVGESEGEYSLFIFGYDGLTITSEDSYSPAQFISKNQKDGVITFVECNNLTVNQVSFAFTQGYFYSASALNLFGCENVKLNDCEFSKGYTGLYINGCGTVNANKCTIQDNVQAVDIDFSSTFVQLKECKISAAGREGKEDPVIRVMDTPVLFEGCTFIKIDGNLLWMNPNSNVTFDKSCTFDEDSANALDAYSAEGKLVRE